ncbi:hypothetical protein AB0K09_08750 [Streptomyces sp. NPDC049577]|uniref:hypothetical protein n=1 Tax=Streptomyces sp. NPDC049577 TaxID=3155153 RepID=UPI00343E2089
MDGKRVERRAIDNKTRDPCPKAPAFRDNAVSGQHSSDSEALEGQHSGKRAWDLRIKRAASVVGLIGACLHATYWGIQLFEHRPVESPKVTIAPGAKS